MSEYNYKSPIEIISNEVEMYIEDEIVKAVQNVGIAVDKNELFKALIYDREQYNKGYHDAEPKVGEWTNLLLNDGWTCSVCGFDSPSRLYNYCPNCGAKMERDEK